MSDSEPDDSNIPPADECERRCQEFAAVTGTDSALAMFYLQDRDWDLDRSLNSYFEEKAAEEPTAKKDVMVVDSPKASDDEDKEPHRIRLISWNIDGLDTKNLRSRTLGVCDTIKRDDPHVVFLQEVVEDSQEILQDQLPMYHFIPGNTEGYYTAMMVKTGHVQVEETKIFEFPSTKMMRNLLCVKCMIKGEKFYLMTSHLESTKDHSAERKKQLKNAFSLFEKIKGERTVVFGGDLNLRDNEVEEVGGLPDKVFDIWEVTGKDHTPSSPGTHRETTTLSGGQNSGPSVDSIGCM